MKKRSVRAGSGWLCVFAAGEEAWMDGNFSESGSRIRRSEGGKALTRTIEIDA